MDHCSANRSIIQDAHVFDVDPHTGFMASRVPLTRLPKQWDHWETTLDVAIESKLQLGDKPCLSIEDEASSEAWRAQVRKLPLLSTIELEASEILLRRAHLVLAFTLHFYIQSLPPDTPVLIPRTLSLPLLRVSTRLDIPPLLTFSDTVLYNWVLKHPSDAPTPALDNIRSHTMFSGLIDEEEFYLCSARIELSGVEALGIMRATMDEVFIGDKTAVRRITEYLQTLARVIEELKELLLSIRRACDPDVYYNQVRPWFRGQDSDEQNRKWVFEGLEEDPTLREPMELSGPSAGQSSLVHVLDLFLGVDHQSGSVDRPSFMSRMQTYMPHNHRLFLNHISSNPRPLRKFVLSAGDHSLLEAYNCAVVALKGFRDAHMMIATLYILGPARRGAQAAIRFDNHVVPGRGPLKGTGGSDLVRFLKGTRTRTIETIIS